MILGVNSDYFLKQHKLIDPCDVSGSHGGEYENYSLQGYSAV
jgi:hypothetical protein